MNERYRYSVINTFAQKPVAPSTDDINDAKAIAVTFSMGDTENSSTIIHILDNSKEELTIVSFWFRGSEYSEN